MLGYTAGNDVSARCWQHNGNASNGNASKFAYDNTAMRVPGGDFNKCVGNGGQWSFSKGFDTHAPMGPTFVLQSELGDGSGLGIQMHLNGKVMQNASTSQMVFGVRHIVEFITTGTTIEAGTVVFTGTMGGVGDLRVPQVSVKPFHPHRPAILPALAITHAHLLSWLFPALSSAQDPAGR